MLTFMNIATQKSSSAFVDTLRGDSVAFSTPYVPMRSLLQRTTIVYHDQPLHSSLLASRVGKTPKDSYSHQGRMLEPTKTCSKNLLLSNCLQESSHKFHRQH